VWIAIDNYEEVRSNMHAYLNAFRNSIDFSGRASRKQYWSFLVCNMMVLWLLMLIASKPSGKGEESAVFLLTGLYLFAIAIPSVAILVRRLHDTDRSGWWVLVSLIPLGGLLLLVFAASAGQPDDNRFGRSSRAGALPYL
jgi:uncharacterized membrane protein YhaH (DUF805 family)